MSEVKRYHFESFIDSYYKHRQFVLASDYDALATEAQALREEVAALKHSQQVLIGSRNAHRDERDAALKEVAALRARVVVVPERLTNGDSISRMLREIGCDGDVSYHHAREIWNACLDGLERLNGKTVSEGLLRRLGQVISWQCFGDCRAFSDQRIPEPSEVIEELRALFNEDKENGNG